MNLYTFCYLKMEQMEYLFKVIALYNANMQLQLPYRFTQKWKVCHYSLTAMKFYFCLLDTQEYVLQNFQVVFFHVIIMNWMLSNLKRDVESLRKDHKSIHMTHASEAIWIKVFNWQCSCVWTIEATQEPEQIIQFRSVLWIGSTK